MVMTPVAALGQEWSVSTGQTLGAAGANAVTGEVGWPGIQGKFLHAVSSHFDAGGQFTFNYGSMVGVGVTPGLMFGGVLRVGLMRQGMVSLGVDFEPSLGFGFDNGGAFLILFPVELQLGIVPSSAVRFVFAMRLEPIIVVGFAGDAGFGMPIEFGPGVELPLDRSLLLTFSTRFGPGIEANGNGSAVGFSFIATFGLAYHL
jgi:hypothetical protein